MDGLRFWEQNAVVERSKTALTSSHFRKTLGATLLILAALFLAGCAAKGLVQQQYSREFYHIPRRLPEGIINKNPTFIVYGDNQACFRVVEGFAKPSNWLTWKMLLFPFYELYWLGNGFVGGVNAARMAPDCGERTRAMMRDAIYDEAKRSNVDFILSVGDMVAHDGRRPEHWARFLRENRTEHPLLNEIPYLPTVGNHERTNDTTYGWPNYQAVFGFPRFYVQEFANAALFVTDSHFIVDLYHEINDAAQDELFEKWFVSSDSEEPAWLERELANCKKTFRIVAIHIPPVTVGHHFTDWTNPAFGRNNADKRDRLLRLLQQHGVQVIFSGHDHIYQHNIITWQDEGDTTAREMHFIVSSGGGVALRDLPKVATVTRLQQRYRESGLEVRSVMMEKVFHYCLVHVDSDLLRIETIEVGGKHGEIQRTLEEIVITNGAANYSLKSE